MMGIPMETLGAALASGAVIGAVLALLGAGGSILAVPLLVYAVGVADPHVAIGTGAVAVTANALTALLTHAKRGNVRWPCGLVFATGGVAGAALGSWAGKAVDGRQLLALFGAVMIVVGITSLRGTPEVALADAVRMNRSNARRLAPPLMLTGLGTGLAAGFFGIGGGFLIVPGIMLASGLPMSLAMGTSLIAVVAFGMTTVGNYAVSGLVDWRLAGLMVAGGGFGAVIGSMVAQKLSTRRKSLGIVFAAVVIVTGLYVTWRGITALG